MKARNCARYDARINFTSSSSSPSLLFFLFFLPRLAFERQRQENGVMHERGIKTAVFTGLNEQRFRPRNSYYLLPIIVDTYDVAISVSNCNLYVSRERTISLREVE